VGIKDWIASAGPVPFDEFMQAALYGPEGYFTRSSLRSVEGGDFLTSPEVSPLFGETLASFVIAEQERLGAPFMLVEVAGGSGSLLGPLLSRWQHAGGGDVWAVEISPAARAALAEMLPPDRVVANLSSVPHPVRGCMIANEFVDNLPMAVARLGKEGWSECWVGMAAGALALVDHPPRPEVAGWLERFAGPVEVGGVVEVQLAAYRWVETALAGLEAGALILIDYGDTADNLAPRRRDGTLRTYRAHHLGPPPLDEPGATDITADVNFTALVAAAEEAGAWVELHRQDDFLRSLGLRERLAELRREELAAASSGDEMARLAVRSRRIEAETLLHPRGLGDFRVLVARK
jgi:SAM-dependent MidA family methyltransferase